MRMVLVMVMTFREWMVLRSVVDEEASCSEVGERGEVPLADVDALRAAVPVGSHREGVFSELVGTVLVFLEAPFALRLDSFSEQGSELSGLVLGVQESEAGQDQQDAEDVACHDDDLSLVVAVVKISASSRASSVRMEIPLKARARPCAGGMVVALQPRDSR